MASSSSEPVRVTPQFKADFDAVVAHYGIAEAGELEEFKRLARGDVPGYTVSLAAMAKAIRQAEPEGVWVQPLVLPAGLFNKRGEA